MYTFSRLEEDQGPDCAAASTPLKPLIACPSRTLYGRKVDHSNPTLTPILEASAKFLPLSVLLQLKVAALSYP